MALKEPERLKEGNFFKRHPFLSSSILVILGSIILTFITPFASRIPTEYTISISGQLNSMIKFITTSLFNPLGAFRDFMLVYILMPTKAAFQSLPWIAVIAFVGLIGYRLGKLR